MLFPQVLSSFTCTLVLSLSTFVLLQMKLCKYGDKVSAKHYYWSRTMYGLFVLCCWRGHSSLQSPLSLFLGSFYVVTWASKEFQLLVQATLGLTSHSVTAPDLIQFKLFSFACPSLEVAT